MAAWCFDDEGDGKQGNSKYLIVCPSSWLSLPTFQEMPNCGIEHIDVVQGGGAADFEEGLF